MNNAVYGVYGKTRENLRKRVDVKVVNNKKDYLRWTSKPSCVAQKIFDNDLVAIHKIRTTLLLNKPAHVHTRIKQSTNV